MLNADSLEAQVPSYEIIFESARGNDFCVVIPVINEGKRIQNLLNKMRKLEIFKIADIIIVDGGSVDGSLDLDFLAEAKVHDLIVKRDIGKLSAQLRCAYSYALAKGYLGVVTIDGNDKDEPDTIPKFIEELQKGYDFIQGSRFINGGVAINTPAIRYFAIRILHAPLLSFFSGFRWTDTTQGYRGYSSKILADKRVNIFRHIFQTYELLAYMSYRAPRLGFRCKEIPTSRIYPQGDIPTKISSVSGNAEVFRILIKSCLGLYNP